MRQSKHIPENVMRGIVSALRSHNPELLWIISDLAQNNEIEGASGRIGESAYGKITGSVPFEDGQRVLEALRRIEQVHGWDARFEDVSISFVIPEWDRFAAPVVLPPQ